MPDSEITYLVCSNADCGLRFPAFRDEGIPGYCPKCKSLLTQILYPRETSEKTDTLQNQKLVVILDNIRSAFNVGAMFRTGDGAGVSHIHVCGITALPDNPKVGKTALGAEKSVPWSYHPNAVDLAANLRLQGYRLWALENTPGSLSIADINTRLAGSPIALAVGNEVTGVDPLILEQCELLIYIPMSGHKRSLNVAIAYGVAVYWLRSIPALKQS